MKANNSTNKFSKHLFWDVDISTIEIKKHSKFIIRKVLQYGSIEDWNELKNYSV